MDLGLSGNPEESFRLFQSHIIEEYEKMIPEYDITGVDATLPIEAQQAQMRQQVKAKLAYLKRLSVERGYIRPREVVEAEIAARSDVPDHEEGGELKKRARGRREEL